MTKKEALKATINYPLPDLTIDKALIDAGLDGTSEYTIADTRVVDIAAIGLLFVLLTSPDIKEGDYARTLPDRSGLLRIYIYLTSKWSLPDLISPKKPTIKGVTPW